MDVYAACRGTVWRAVPLGRGAADRRGEHSYTLEGISPRHFFSLTKRIAMKRSQSKGFTLIEAMLALSIVSIAGSAILVGLANSIDSTVESVDRTVALGMAQQLMHEIEGKRYAGAGLGPYQAASSFGANSTERAGLERERYDDLDDFDGYTTSANSAPTDPWGIALGQDDADGDSRHTSFRIASDLYTDWRYDVQVYYVDPDDLSQSNSSGSTSDYRAVEVRVYIDDADGSAREIASLRKVFSYVPNPS